MATTFTDREKKILKKFVKELQKVAVEIKKNDKIVRVISFNSIIKNALREDE